MGLTGQQNRLAGTAGSLDSAVPAVSFGPWTRRSPPHRLAPGLGGPRRLVLPLDSAVPAVAQKVQRAQQAVIYSVGLK